MVMTMPVRAEKKMGNGCAPSSSESRITYRAEYNIPNNTEHGE